MFLPATEVSIPSEDFIFRNFSPTYVGNKRMSFTAEIFHSRTGGVLRLDNGGEDIDTLVQVDHKSDRWQDTYKAWHEFVESCQSILVENSHGTDQEGFYDEGENLEEGVIRLFANEAEYIKELNRRRNLVWRTPYMGKREYRLCLRGTTLEELKASITGTRIIGKYWDRAFNRWIELP